MIVKQEKLGFFGLLVEMRGSIVPAIMPHIISSALLGVIACILTNTGYIHSSTEAANALKIGFGPFTALGVAISLFLGFHNNASYSRWWEARILWGKQIIVTRDIARFLLATMQSYDDDDDDKKKDRETEENSNTEEQITIVTRSNSNAEEWNGQIKLQNLVRDIESNYTSFTARTTTSDSNERKEVIRGWKANIVRLSCAHTHSFRHQMRPNCTMDGINTALRDRNRFLTKMEERELVNCRNPANSILFMASKILGSAYRLELIDTYSMIHVQQLIDKLCEIQTACERIHNTSLPLAYSLLVHRTSVLYVLLVPFAIVDNVGWWTPLFTAIVAYTFFGLDQLAKEIQEPFSDRPMCLALSAMSRTIEIDVLEALGLETPMPLKPKGTKLM